MAKHPASRRVHREHVDEDVFVSGVLETGVWARHHGRILAIGGGALLAAVIIFAYVRNFNAKSEASAATELTSVRQTVLQGNKQLAIRDLNSFVNKYGSTASAAEARLLLAQEYMEAGQPAKAVDAVKDLGKDPGKANGASAALILAAAYEASKQPEKAEETYIRIADRARYGFEKRTALDRAAVIKLSRGDAKGAAELYERSLKTLKEDDPERPIYEMRIAEVRAGTKTGS